VPGIRAALGLDCACRMAGILTAFLDRLRLDTHRDRRWVWAHKITSEGDSEGLPALLEVHCGDETTRFDLKLSGGQALLPLTGQPCRLEITLSEQ